MVDETQEPIEIDAPQIIEFEMSEEGPTPESLMRMELIEAAQLLDGYTKLVAAMVMQQGGTVTVLRETLLNLPPTFDLESEENPLNGSIRIRVFDRKE